MRGRSIIFIFIALVFVVAGIAGWLLLYKGSAKKEGGLSAEELALLGGIGVDVDAKNAGATNDANTVDAVQNADVGGRLFQHPRLGFTLELPDGFSVGKFEEEESGVAGEMTLVRGSDNAELQIYATAFDEEGSLTVERIRKDLPEMKIIAPQQVVLHGGMPALVFLSENAAFGKTQEVWFAHSGFLYQLTTTAPMKKEIAKIIGSMKF